MLKIRNLEEGDFKALSEFILEIYREYPASMWFEREPTPESLERLFQQKLQGMAEKRVVDVVVDDGSIIGEAEIAKVAGPIGYVGIIIRKEHRGRGLGAHLLERAYAQASLNGITELRAEVAEGNSAALRLFEKQGFEFASIEDSKIIHDGKNRKIRLLRKRV